MFKRILVPIDPARPLQAANDYACRLAKRFGSTIVANYIVDETLSSGAGEAVGALDVALEYVGRDAVEQFVHDHPDLSVEKRMSYGHTATVIFQTVLGAGIDLVVIGGYHRGATPYVWGSTVVEVVNVDERPTFVVRKDRELPRPDEHIVVPYDGSRRSVDNIPRICKLAKELECGIELVYAARRKEADQALHILERGQIQVEGEGVPVRTVALERKFLHSKGHAILDHARAQDAPLIALSRLGRTSEKTGVSRTVPWLLTHSEIPVWVVRR